MPAVSGPVVLVKSSVEALTKSNSWSNAASFLRVSLIPCVVDMMVLANDPLTKQGWIDAWLSGIGDSRA